LFINNLAYKRNGCVDRHFVEHEYNNYKIMIKKLFYLTRSLSNTIKIPFSNEDAYLAEHCTDNFTISDYSAIYSQYTNQIEKNVLKFYAKLRSMVSRISLVLSIAENPNLNNIFVSEHHVIFAIEITKALLTHADYALNPSGYQAFKTAEKLLDFFKLQSFSHVTLRYITQQRGFLQNSLLPALQLLEQANCIKKIPGPKRAPAYVIHPNLVPLALPPAIPTPPIITPTNPAGNLPGSFHSNL
jgi:hypothetical protein